jgi:hypothetical protein
MRCPQGHESEESDYCSVCGIAMAPAAAGAAPAGTAAPAPPRPPAPAPPGTTVGKDVCPSCGEPRTDPSARYCEVCRFDFVTGAPGPPPVEAAAAPTAPGAAAAAPGAAAGAGTPDPTGAPPAPVSVAPTRWQAVVTVDPALDLEPDPAEPCPENEPERVFPLDLAETLIGRRDDRRDIRPEIPLHDPGASRRHAQLLLGPDGGLALVDLASTNGTRLNGFEIISGARHPLKGGDEVTIGRWSRIVIRSHP